MHLLNPWGERRAFARWPSPFGKRHFSAELGGIEFSIANYSANGLQLLSPRSHHSAVRRLQSGTRCTLRLRLLGESPLEIQALLHYLDFTDDPLRLGVELYPATTGAAGDAWKRYLRTLQSPLVGVAGDL